MLRPCLFFTKKEAGHAYKKHIVHFYLGLRKFLLRANLSIYGSMNATNFLAIYRSLTCVRPKFHTRKIFSFICLFGFTLDSSSVNRTRSRTRSIRTRTRDLQF